MRRVIRQLALVTLLPFLLRAACLHAQTPNLKKFLQKWVRTPGDNLADLQTTQFDAVPVHLHGDDRTQWIVYLSGGGWCGSGGCTMLVLEPTATSFHTIAYTTITWPPIRVLDTQTHGWHDLGVLVAGGGILNGYEARLRFSGRRYPGNPSLQPPTHLSKGQTVLADSTKAAPLFP
jgi:hypothetical protein